MKYIAVTLLMTVSACLAAENPSPTTTTDFEPLVRSKRAWVSPAMRARAAERAAASAQSASRSVPETSTEIPEPSSPIRPRRPNLTISTPTNSPSKGRKPIVIEDDESVDTAPTSTTPTTFASSRTLFSESPNGLGSPFSGVSSRTEKTGDSTPNSASPSRQTSPQEKFDSSPRPSPSTPRLMSARRSLNFSHAAPPSGGYSPFPPYSPSPSRPTTPGTRSSPSIRSQPTLMDAITAAKRQGKELVGFAFESPTTRTSPPSFLDEFLFDQDIFSSRRKSASSSSSQASSTTTSQ